MTDGVRPASVVRRRKLSARVSELLLEVPGEPAFRWHAGQHLAIHLPGGVPTHAGPLWYSIASAWDGKAPSRLKLAVGPGTGGELLAAVRAGDELGISGPYGTFALPPAPAVLLVGVGTGVAPLRAFAEEALARGPDTKVTLLVGARTPDDLLWHDELTALAARNERFRYVPVLSRSETEWSGLAGYVQHHLDDEVARLPAGFVVRACGSEAMVEAVLAALDRLGVSRERIDSQSYS
jgi:CDP-4-dehydro-6-deoxyglucose reductase